MVVSDPRRQPRRRAFQPATRELLRDAGERDLPAGARDIESCFSGAFCEADLGGLDFGCGASAGSSPLYGVALITAANDKEVSYAGAYDGAVPAWVNDAFSRQFAANALVSFDRSVADVYADAYHGTAGSHPSIYNADNAGRLTLVPIGEFFSP